MDQQTQMKNTLEKTKTDSNRADRADVVYLLWHSDAYQDEKLIGVYRTEDDALAAVERLRVKPGFSDDGGKFECARYELNQDHWTEGFGRPED